MPRTYSPMRYPGGKTQLSDFLKQLLKINELNDIIYAEPFAGGFGAGLDLLFNNKVKSVIINDYDISIYSIWNAILNEPERIVNDIMNTDITIEEWEKQRNIYDNLLKKKKYSYELAFATYFLNRTNRSGIITGGPIGGKSQSGAYTVDCRFNKADLIKKIIKIAEHKDRIQLYNLEANDFIDEIGQRFNSEEIFIFFDPPYYQQGKNLYTNFFQHDDHVKLKEKIELLNNYYWIMTYDNQYEILSLYEDYNKYLYSINYYANSVRKAKEILVHSDRMRVESCGRIKVEKVMDYSLAEKNKENSERTYCRL